MALHLLDWEKYISEETKTKYVKLTPEGKQFVYHHIYFNHWLDQTASLFATSLVYGPSTTAQSLASHFPGETEFMKKVYLVTFGALRQFFIVNDVFSNKVHAMLCQEAGIECLNGYNAFTHFVIDCDNQRNNRSVKITSVRLAKEQTEANLCLFIDYKFK